MSSNPELVETEGASAPRYTGYPELPTGWGNLQQEATWLYEDNIKLSNSLKYYRESFAEGELKNQQLTSEILNIKEENRILKRKLNNYWEREVTHKETLKELIEVKEERTILQRRTTEDEQLREQTETQDAEIRKLQAKLRDQQQQMEEYQRITRELNDKLHSTQYIADLESERRKALEGKVKKMQDKLRILSTSTVHQEQFDDDAVSEMAERGRFKRHRIDECRRCHTCLPSETYCVFHDKAPVQVLIKDSNGHISRPDNQKFWPCCGKTGTKEPEGCKSFPVHVRGY